MKIINYTDKKWNERFAGLIDGDGCFYINKKNEISFEITTHIKEARILYDIKKKLNGGSIKLKSGSKSVRYRVKKIIIIKNIINRIQNKLYHPIKIEQLKKCCILMNIDYIISSKLNPDSAYLSGLFDSDGTVVISVLKSSQLNSQKTGVAGKITRLSESKGYNQLTIKITSIHKNYLLMLKNVFSLGLIYCENFNYKNKSPNNKYHWIIRNSDQCDLFYQYIKKNPLYSIKMHRVRLSSKYFIYKKLKYHLKPENSIEYKIWLKFCKSWFKYSE